MKKSLVKIEKEMEATVKKFTQRNKIIEAQRIRRRTFDGGVLKTTHAIELRLRHPVE